MKLKNVLILLTISSTCVISAEEQDLVIEHDLFDRGDRIFEDEEAFDKFVEDIEDDQLAPLDRSLRVSKRWMSVSYCGQDHPFKLNKFQVTPDPLTLSKNNHVRIFVDMETSEQLDGETEVRVKLRRKAFLFSVAVGCYSLGDYSIGSCTYKVKDLMRLVQTDKEGCQKFMPPGQKCEAPLKPGKYSGYISLVVPEIPAKLSRWASGKYKLDFQMFRPDGRQIACLNGQFRINRY